MPAQIKVSSGASESSVAASRRNPTHAEIERRAYFIFLGRGAANGWDVEDWLQAEDELNKEYGLKEAAKQSKPRKQPVARARAFSPKKRGRSQ